MRTPYNPNQSPRVIIIQKLYGNFFNDDTGLTFPKHRFKKFIKDTNLRSVTQTLKNYKNKAFYKKGNDKLIRNYGIGAQIIKDLKIKNMILITKSLKKVIGLEGYDIKITKQEII